MPKALENYFPFYRFCLGAKRNSMSFLPKMSHRNVARAKQPSARQGKESLAQQTVTTSLTHSDGQIALEGDEGGD